MGEVIDLEEYRRTREILHVLKPCKLPWHRKRYIKNGRCTRCKIAVREVNHPSFKKPRYRE